MMRVVRPRSDWKLVFKVAPVVATSVAVKLAFDLLGWDTIALNALYSGLVAATVFLIGFLLAGTLADYKESEWLPGELAGRAEAIADECQILYRDTGVEAARGCLQHVGRLAGALNAWLRGRDGVEVPLERIEEFNHFFLDFQPLTQPNFIVRLKQEQSALRLLVTRINTIHCVNLAQGLKEPVIYYQQHPEKKYVDAVKKALADIRKYHGQPQGMYGGDEALHGNNPTQGSELCSAVELMFSLEKMMGITGDLQFAEHLERIAFNALPTQIADDFMTRQYFQQANQVMITRHPRNFDNSIYHGDIRDGKGYDPSEKSSTTTCSMRPRCSRTTTRPC
jgi:hypothetical protein